MSYPEVELSNSGNSPDSGWFSKRDKGTIMLYTVSMTFLSN